jgi:hypothetical protein
MVVHTSMQTGEHIQQRPTHRKELSDEFFAANFVPETEQILVEINQDEQQKLRRKRVTSFVSPATMSVPSRYPNQRLFLVSGMTISIIVILFVLYLFFVNEVVTRRIRPRIALWFDHDRNIPHNSCIYFTNEKIKTIFSQKIFRELLVSQSMIDDLVGKDIIRIAFVNNHLYVNDDDAIPEHYGLWLDFFTDLTSQYVVPDTIFALHVGKNPPTQQNALFTIHEDTNNVMINIPNTTAVHYWENEEKYKLNKYKSKNLFQDREKVALYRGSYSNPNKSLMQTSVGTLLTFSMRYPELVDAKLTSCTACTDDEISMLKSKGQLLSHPLTFETEVQYRTQIILAPEIPLRKLYTNSLILSVESLLEHYRAHLTPYSQFVPIKEDLSDLAQKLRWITEYHDHVTNIANRAEKLAEVLLGRSCALFYWKVILERYAKHQKLDVREIVRKKGWSYVTPYRIYS